MQSATAPLPHAHLTPDARYPATAPARIAGAVPARAGEPGLSAAELEFFHERGWVLVRGLVAREQIAALGRETDGLHERMAAPGAEASFRDHSHGTGGVGVSWEESLDDTKPKRIRQLMGSQLVSPLIDQISRSEAVLAIMRQLIGPDVSLYHSKLMMKAANDGSFTPWHQDFQYWQGESVAPTQINCMLSIDGSDLDNGCLRMVDGSQRSGLLPIHRLKSSSFSLGLAGGLEDFPSTPVATEPGDAILFGCYVVHGSGPNTSARHRRANTFAFDRPGNWRQDRGEQHALPLAFHRCGQVDPLSR